jgi:hypothetical protein
MRCDLLWWLMMSVMGCRGCRRHGAVPAATVSLLSGVWRNHPCVAHQPLVSCSQQLVAAFSWMLLRCGLLTL